MDYIPIQSAAPVAEARITNHGLPLLGEAPVLQLKGAARLAPGTGAAGWIAAGDRYTNAAGAVGHKLDSNDNVLVTAAASLVETADAKHLVAVAGVATSDQGQPSKIAYAVAGIARDTRDDYTGDYRLFVAGAQHAEDSAFGYVTGALQGLGATAKYAGGLRPDYAENFYAIRGEASLTRPLGPGGLTAGLGLHFADKAAPRFAQLTPNTGRGSAFEPDAFSATQAVWLKAEYEFHGLLPVRPFVGVDAVFVGSQGLTGKARSNTAAKFASPQLASDRDPQLASDRDRFTSGYIGIRGEFAGVSLAISHARDLDQARHRTLASASIPF